VRANCLTTSEQRGALQRKTVLRVKKRFGATPAIEGVSFEVKRGEMVGIIGPQRRGKIDAHPLSQQARKAGHPAH
jgi:ABC-type glutathione transport system ATPase component